ncbi:grainyhead-like protein 2 homolog isoform 2-T2 [Aulostomus maculatus]
MLCCSLKFNDTNAIRMTFSVFGHTLYVIGCVRENLRVRLVQLLRHPLSYLHKLESPVSQATHLKHQSPGDNMDLDSKQLVVVVPNDVSVPSRRLFSSEYEAWQSYLENPLTAATKAMMSINGDEDSSAALGLLYDHCKVPKEKRCVSSNVKPREHSALWPDDCRGLNRLHHLQALKSVPVNLSLNSSAITEHESLKYRAQHLTGDIRGGEGKGGAALTLVKREGHISTVFSCSGGSCPQELREQKGMIYEPSCNGLDLAGYLKEEQRISPDSLNEDVVGGEMDNRHSPLRADESQHSLLVDGFQYYLDASMSLWPRQGDGPMAYLNRGQFYALTLSATSLRPPRCKPRVKLQSVIMVVFGDDKCRDQQLKNWKYWHSRQHSAKQRVLDIADCKERFSRIENVEEIAYNAVSFTWDATEEAKVSISVNCLSTDFTPQKGVKGMPMTIQVDTYSYNSYSRPIHRAFSQIKVFCDKGAERKLRDEEKKQQQLRKRRGKNGRLGPTPPIKSPDSKLFKTKTDLDTQPILFIPDVHFGNLQRAGVCFRH